MSIRRLPCLHQLRAHHLVQQVDGLERPHHHLEAGDAAVPAPEDHVDAVDADPVDLAGELQDRRPLIGETLGGPLFFRISSGKAPVWELSVMGFRVLMEALPA